jgi:hypothetical protein
MDLPIVQFDPNEKGKRRRSKRDEELEASSVRSHAARIGFRRRVTGESFMPPAPTQTPGTLMQQLQLRPGPSIVGDIDPFAVQPGYQLPALGYKALEYGM